MSDNERAIRELCEAWFDATRRGDLKALQGMITDDVVFLSAGRPPMDADGFAAMQQAGFAQQRIECSGGYEEVIVVHDVAYARAYLQVAITPLASGDKKQLAGYTLTVFRKTADGRWRIARDANLLAPVT